MPRLNLYFFVYLILSASILYAGQDYSQLPQHKFEAASGAKSQIRAIVKVYPKTEVEWRQLALNLAAKNPAFGSYLVNFFDNESCLNGWDGTGLLRDKDLPHWLGRATVETDTNGTLYTRTFKVAPNEKTGEPRTDILK
ncbi:MAG: hypothetical protein WA081_03085 [Desulfosalsimonadaceae bacterium]